MKKIITRTTIILIFIIQTLSGQIQFAWITDTHIGSPNAENDLIQIVNDINRRDIKFTIITGDITEKGLNSELHQAKSILDKLNKPYFIIPGNHDTKWSESGCTKFLEIFGDDKFIFYYDNFYFIGLNSGIPLRGGGGHIAPEDVEWLKAKLGRLNFDTKIILAVHHQLDGEIDNYKEVLQLLSKFRKVFVIVGHGHSNRSYSFTGLKGAMGRSALSKGKTPGYNLVTLFGDSVSIQTIDFDNNKEWYRNSISRTENFEKKNLSEKDFSSGRLIFDSKSTVVKTGAVTRGRLFFADLRGNIYSISLNGKLNWRKYFSTSFFAKPIAYKNQIIFCGTDGNVYLLSQNNGHLIKSLKLSASIIATPVIHNNNLIVLTNDGKINFINLKNFETQSFKIAEKNFEAIPLLFKNNIFIGNWDNYLYSINLNLSDSILVKWKWTENKNFYYSPAVCTPLADNLERIFISTPDKFLSAIDFHTGRTIFRTNTFNNWESMGIDGKKKLLFIKGLIDTLYALNIQDSTIELEWKTSLGFGLDTNPIQITEKGGLVFVSAKNGNLYTVNKNTGKLIEKIFLGNTRLNEVIPLNKKYIIVSNMDGKFFRIKINRKEK